jgi:hypothetical protein
MFPIPLVRCFQPMMIFSSLQIRIFVMTIRGAKFLLAAGLLLLLPLFASAQQTTTVPRLPPAGSLNSTDIFPLDQQNNASATGWTTRRGSFSQLQSFFLGNIVGIPSAWTAAQAFDGGATVPTLPFGDNSLNAASTAFVQSAIAGSVGGLPSVASPAALAAATVPNAQTRITVLAMASSGTSTCSLDFTQGISTPTGIYGEVLNTLSGIYWEPQYSTDPIRACEFGTISDGSIVQNFTTGATTFGGTDNTAAIQAAINFGLQNSHNSVCLNGGKYRTTDTLHLGWGDSFYSINLDACNYTVASSVGAVNIYADGIGDRCAINIQGGRGSGVHHINLSGLNTTWAFASTFPNPWPTVASGWLLPSLIPTGTNPGGLTRYAPYGGICEDAYSGQPPSALGANANYPLVTNYPAFTTLSSTNVSIAPAGGAGTNAVVTWGTQHWLTTNCNILAFGGNCPIVFTAGSLPAGLSLNTLYYVSNYVSGATFNISATPGGAAITISASAAGVSASRQFGMSFSSQSTVNDGTVNGFAVNLNWGSHTTNSQGDFFHAYNINSSFCVYCYSVGNDQSRNVEISDSQFAFCYAALTNVQFGERAGKLGGPINNLSGGECYEAFDIGAQNFGFPVLINTFYAEALTRFANFGVASTPNGIIVNGCDISFGSGLAGANVTLPVALMEMGGAPVTLNDCSFSNGPGRIDVLAHGGSGSLNLSGGIWQAGTVTIPQLNLPGIQVAHSYTGGILASGTAYTISQNGTNVSNGITWRDPIFAYKMTGQATFSGAQQMKAGADFTTWGVRAVYTQATQGWFELNNRAWRQFAAAPLVGNPNLSSATYTTVPAAMSSCDVLTFNYKQAGIDVGNNSINVGDILYWTGDGTIFVVTNVGALTGGAYPYTAKQMNNMVVNQTTGACVTSLLNDPTLTGTTTIIHASGTNFLDLLNGAVVATPGTGYTPGTQTLTATGGTCTTEPQFTVTVNAAGQVTVVTANTVPAVCTVLPTSPVTMTGGGGTGATLNLITAPDNIRVPQALFYADVTQGNAVLGNISLNGVAAAPNGATIDTWMKPGDILWSMNLADPAAGWPFPNLGVSNALSTLGPVSSGTGTTPGSAFVNGLPNITGRFPLSPLPLVGVGAVGYLASYAATPTIASGACGTGANGAVVAGSTNQAGKITIGASATTTCTITWGINGAPLGALAAAPKQCQFYPNNAAAAAVGTTVAFVSAPTTTGVTLNGSALAGANYAYYCARRRSRIRCVRQIRTPRANRARGSWRTAA